MELSLTKVIIGLGNPGEKYACTRHNLGWMVVDDIAAALSPVYESQKWHGIMGEKGGIGLFKPLTYMNNSGKAVAGLMKALGLAGEDILVVSDDMALDLGCIRIRASGSSGGHRGLQSVIDHLGTEEFPRLRLGIGPCPEEVPGRAFVLGRFSSGEERLLRSVVTAARNAGLHWLEHGTVSAIHRFNGRIC